MLEAEEEHDLPRRLWCCVAMRTPYATRCLRALSHGLPLGIGHTTVTAPPTLFAPHNYLEGKLITTFAEKQSHEEWLAFLQKIDH